MFIRKCIFAAASAATLLAVAGCTSNGINNIISGATGGKGQARAIDAAPSAPGPLSMLVANTTVNSGLTASTPVGVYALVGAGNQNFQITPTNIPASTQSIAASVFYSFAVAGEPGQPDFATYLFQDTNSSINPSTVRYKVNDAALAPGAIDVYFYQGTLPALPTVPGLTVGKDSGSIANAPGNAYIPTLGSSTIVPSGTYTITVTPAGNPSTTLFTGSANLTVGNSYSFTIEDVPSGSASAAQVILAIDQPTQNANQSNLMSVARRR